MAEYRLSYTAFEINEKLGKVVDETVTESDINELFVEIGTFAVNQDSFNFEVGITWEEYINSDYNTNNNFSNTNGNVYYFDGIGTGSIRYKNETVKISDSIVNGGEYLQTGTN